MVHSLFFLHYIFITFFIYSLVLYLQCELSDFPLSLSFPLSFFLIVSFTHFTYYIPAHTPLLFFTLSITTPILTPIQHILIAAPIPTLLSFPPAHNSLHIRYLLILILILNAILIFSVILTAFHLLPPLVQLFN